MTEEISKFDGADVKRRALIKGAAWSVPVIAVAVAAPAHAASGDVVENVQVEGRCGGIGVAGQGFAIDSGGSTIPAASTITITRSGPVSLGLGSWSLAGFDSLLTATVTTNDQHVYIFTNDWNGSGSLGALAAINLVASITAKLTFPPGTNVGTGNKLSGSIEQLVAVVCRAS